jgi:hypothetical protein
MTQPLHDALPGDRQRDDRAFAAIISAPELRSVDLGPGIQGGTRRDIRRIASALFCSATVDASLVTFAKQRTAQHWNLTEEEIDVQVTAGLIAKAARLMADRHILAAHRLAGLSDAA